MGSYLMSMVEVLLAMQMTQATVAGTVRDVETDAPLFGAVVTLTELDRSAATDTGGRYELREVPAGPHHITVRLIGYAERSLHALVPRAGRLEISLSLRPEPIRLKAVEVRAPVIVRGFDRGDTTSYPDRRMSVVAVGNHPQLSEPDVFQALGGGEVVLRAEAPSGVHIRGGASDQTGYLLDGIPVFSPYHAAGISSAWNPDAISRLDLSTSAPSPAYPNVLSGAIEAVTRAPGERHRAQGSVSTTQARITLDGPLGPARTGYLVSLRSGVHDLIAPRDQASYLKGESGDWLGKLETPWFGGGLRFLGYANWNEVNTVPSEGQSGAGTRRNVFEWHSRSLGTEWWRVFPRTTARVLGWSATGDAGSGWATVNDRIEMSGRRRDEGLRASIEHRWERATTIAEIRVEQSRTSYRIDSDSVAGPVFELDARTPLATAIARHGWRVGRRVELDLGSSLTAGGGDLHLGPNARLRWNVSEAVTLSGSYARAHQFAQSLRNAESVVSNVFPVDVYMGAGTRGFPVARSDHGVIAAGFRPVAGVRVGVQAYERGSDGLVLVAPRDGEPFTTGRFAVGSGSSRGISADLAVSSTRYGIVASYGLQRVRFQYGDSSYVPDHGARHLLEGGVIVFPSATASLRIGAVAAFGRRTTAIPGGFEWESCNLVDGGCEFVGSPHYGDEPLGGTPLPPYFRVDLGVRKHWHLELGGRDTPIAVFGTFTNILQRKNLLTYARDPSTGEPVEIEMRPPAPLVVGIDWRF